jgi:hypothetical protein
MSRVLSAELFREYAGLSQSSEGSASELATQCHNRWIDLADSLAALPEPAELIAVMGSRPEATDDSAWVSVSFLSLGRGSNATDAEANCAHSRLNLWTLLETILDYAELEPIADKGILEGVIKHLHESYVIEVRRRLEEVRVSHGVFVGAPAGFEGKRVQPVSDDKECSTELQFTHLYPWVPSDDPWRRLLEALSDEPASAALVIHFRGWSQVPEDCRKMASKALVVAERIAAFDVENRTETVPQLQAEALRHEALRRLSILEGRVVASRVFITASRPPSSALVATVESCLDDASVRPGQTGADSMFRGGAQLISTASSEILSQLDRPSIDLLFGPREASAILRTPMPSDVELPGLSINRARTAPIVGRSGDDAPLGTNVHRGLHLPLSLDGPMRFRHTYVVGQTGTGKSTFLLHMILHDIAKGRGVAVLDAHGTLIEQVLLHYPPERMEDLIVVDVTDVECPIGFNVLRIEEEDPLEYRLARDLVIDDLYSYIDRTYDLKQVGGPMFEMHFRGMLGLLLGLEKQEPPLIPNLMIFRLLYTNSRLRRTLVERVKNKDLMLDDFIEEAVEVTGEGSLKNMSPYITSKFSRFVSDLTLRNMTCQNSTLDFDEVVKGGKVLLFYLGKGHFGDYAAGLLASQIISRIRYVVMKRGARQDARPFYLYADEFQLFADDRFTELLAEARKFKLSLTLAHQYAKQIPEKVLQGVLGNVGTTVVFRVGAVDGEFFEPLFKPSFNQRDLSSLPNFRAYVRSFGSLGHTPFSVETGAPLSGGNPEQAEALRQRSRQKYGRDRRIVEEEIKSTYEAYKKISDKTSTLLEALETEDKAP